MVGTIAEKYIEYLPLEDARKFVRLLNLTKRDEWYAYCKVHSTLGPLEEKKEIMPSQSIEENLPIEYEIECPRCHDLMTLQSEFDKLIYFCEECNFSLSLIHK